ELIHLVAQHNLPPDALEVYRRTYPLSPSKDKLLGEALLDRRPVNIADVLTTYRSSIGQRELGQRSVLAVPMLREGVAIGVIATSRNEPGLFPEKQVELLKTFADQAVIAIENVRLFDEVQARPRELTEYVEQQFPSADLFRIISGLTFQLHPVLDELVKSAARLFQAEKVAVFLRDGELSRVAARHGFPSAFQEYFEAQPIPLPPANIAEQSSVGSRLVHIPDIMADPEFTWQEVQKNAFLRGLLGSGIARAGVIADCRAFLSVPLLREGILIGTIVAARTVPQSFTAKQI